MSFQNFQRGASSHKLFRPGGKVRKRRGWTLKLDTGDAGMAMRNPQWAQTP